MICHRVSCRIATQLFTPRFPFRDVKASNYCCRCGNKTTGAFSNVSGRRGRTGIVIPLCWVCVYWTKTPFMIKIKSCWTGGGSTATVCETISFIWTIRALFNLVESLRICVLCYRKELTNVTSSAAYIPIYAIWGICLFDRRYRSTSKCTWVVGTIVKTRISLSNRWVNRVSGFNNQVIQSNFSAVTPLHNF